MKHLLLILAMTATAMGVPKLQTIDLTTKNGLRILKGFSGKPDKLGILGEFDLKLPAFKRGVYYQGGWWPSGGNRVYSHVVRPKGDGAVDILEVNDSTGAQGGLFAIFELETGEYLAVLPLTGDAAYAWFTSVGGKITKRPDRQAPTESFNCEGGRLALRFGHHGTASVSCDQPLVAWATARNPYKATNKVWNQATELAGPRVKMRETKPYPEIFKYLGWCSWDCIGMKCNEELMLKALKGIDASDVPIRWALMDDGHYDKKTLANDVKDFPHSYGSMMKYRRPEKIKWLGIWYAMFGNFGGTKVNPAWDPVKEHYEVVGKRMMPKNNLASARAFYRHMFREAKKYDFDLLKTDFQTHNIGFYRGGNWKKPGNGRSPFANPYAASANAQRGFHEVVAEEYKGLINCNWHNAVCVFNSFDSVVGRCSEDNKGGEQDAISHTFHAFMSTPWLGQVAWGDHDMFHSGDRSAKAAKFNVIAKAMSGGPIYLSEFAEKFRTEYILPLAYTDGRLLRPLAPAAPLTEDLFHQLYEERLVAAAAPLANQSAVFVVFGTNRRGAAARKSYTRTLTADDYAAASGMIQPYPGRWPIPPAGLLVYDWYNKKAVKLGKGYTVKLKGFDYRVLQVSPIVNGWSVIGRTDKYLSAAAVKTIKASKDSLTVELHEAGPLTIWSEAGAPKAAGITFSDIGNGLYSAAIPMAAKMLTIEITR